MDYKGHKLYLQNKDGKFEEFTFEMAIELISGQTKYIDELQNKIDKVINILELSSQNKGMCTRPETDTIQSALIILKGDDNNETNNN